MDPIERKRAERRALLATASAMTFREGGEAYIEGARRELAQREAPAPVAQHARDLRLSRHRRLASPGGRHRPRDAGAGADLADEARDGEPGARADRGRSGLGHGARLPRATTRRAGAAISTSCCRRGPRSQGPAPAGDALSEVPAFMARLRAHDSISARGARVHHPGGLRTSEAIRATGTRSTSGKALDLPGTRIKAGREHRVPLSAG